MKIQHGKYKGRLIWKIENEVLSLTVMEGGGHIAGLILKERPLNPYWSPVWKTIEPWHYRAGQAKRFGGSKLLASISGHNICLGVFGGPSEQEARAGLDCHGEAPVTRWRVTQKKATADTATLLYGCKLPDTQMRIIRKITMKKNSNIIRVQETLQSAAKRDMPFTMCEHVTFGPPFLEKGVTVFDMPATRGHVFPAQFSGHQRLKENTAFAWPKGPGIKGAVDMRMIGRQYKVSSDFSAQLMDQAKQDAWFSAVNPQKGLMIAYLWKRSDFPWVGNWEENYGRLEKPWDGKSLTRGMEFSNSPFPSPLRKQVDMGTFQGEKTFRWLPARGKITMTYNIIALPVGPGCRGVADISESRKGINVDLRK